MNKKPVIVIAEDEPMELLHLAQALQQKSDFVIHQALSAEEALEICARTTPDIIISDYSMPGENGFEFCAKVKRDPALRKVFFILLTGMNEVEKIVEGLDTGADDYITKPYHPEEVRSRVNAFLRIKKLQDTVDEDNLQLESLNAELEESFRGIVTLLCDLMELRVPNASLRAARAEKIISHISTKLALTDREASDLHYAARLHEIGKISMPDHLVAKNPRDLSEEDRRELGNFPIRGQLLMREIPVLKSVARILRHQMENYDGTGYPDRLNREEIPLGSRILRVIAGIEAAHALSPKGDLQALEAALIEKQGIYYDPRMLQLIIDYLRSETQGFIPDHVLQLTVGDLIAGMVTAHDVFTCSGKKLLSAGTVLTEKIILNIHAHHQKDPILVGVYVYIQGA